MRQMQKMYYEYCPKQNNEITFLWPNKFPLYKMSETYGRKLKEKPSLIDGTKDTRENHTPLCAESNMKK